MKLKSFGCSFIFGTDLSDAVTIPGMPVVPSQTTWPAHLARYLGYSYSCYARPGAGNLQIVESILNQAANSDNTDLFVIGWTWIDRFDYIDVKNKWPDATPWSTIMPVDATDVAKIYYRDLHSEYRDKLTTLMSMRLVIDLLNQKGVPFVMTCVDDLIFDQRWHTTPAVTDLQEYIKPYMTMFDDQTFLDWSRANNYTESSTWHPLEEAHRAAADCVIKVFDTQKTNVLTQ
jgi:hypothetical protein